MKKLLALVVVLAMAGFANAGLIYQTNDQAVASGMDVVLPAGIVEFSVANETAATGVFDGAFIALYGDATYGAAEIVPGQLPGQWSIQDLGLIDLGKGEVPVMFLSWDAPAIDPVKAGKLFFFQIDFKGPNATVEVLNISAEPIYAVNYIVPEPMTLTLLGLGALVLRRRS